MVVAVLLVAPVHAIARAVALPRLGNALWLVDARVARAALELRLCRARAHAAVGLIAAVSTLRASVAAVAREVAESAPRVRRVERSRRTGEHAGRTAVGAVGFVGGVSAVFHPVAGVALGQADVVVNLVRA